jgi:hypothetical protein
MLKNIQSLPLISFILVATIFEVSGDAIIRSAIYKHSGLMRIALMLIGATLLFAYATSLNLAPVEFGQVVGLYIATLFIVWQVINFIAFRTLPSLHVIVGGIFVIVGGLIITFATY